MQRVTQSDENDERPYAIPERRRQYRISPARLDPAGLHDLAQRSSGFCAIFGGATLAPFVLSTQRMAAKTRGREQRKLWRSFFTATLVTVAASVSGCSNHRSGGTGGDDLLPTTYDGGFGGLGGAGGMGGNAGRENPVCPASEPAPGLVCVATTEPCTYERADGCGSNRATCGQGGWMIRKLAFVVCNPSEDAGTEHEGDDAGR